MWISGVALSSGLASDSLLFPNPASPDPVSRDGVVITSCDRWHQLTEDVKGELYIDSLEASKNRLALKVITKYLPNWHFFSWGPQPFNTNYVASESWTWISIVQSPDPFGAGAYNL